LSAVSNVNHVAAGLPAGARGRETGKRIDRTVFEAQRYWDEIG
jgi:hypothetical protein